MHVTDEVIKECLNCFVDMANAVEGITVCGTEIVNGKEHFLIDNKRDKRHEQIRIPVSEVVAKVKDTATAKQIIDVILYNREAFVLQGYTRLVGYFSKVSNWNKSKLSELKDRQNGSYSVCEGRS